jgi:hypothetical protein
MQTEHTKTRIVEHKTPETVESGQTEMDISFKDQVAGGIFNTAGNQEIQQIYLLGQILVDKVRKLL